MSATAATAPPDAATPIAVLGAGVSGAAAARALLAAGHRPGALRVLDTRATATVRQTADALSAEGVDVGLAVDDPDRLDGVALVIASPGLPARHPLLAAALGRGLQVWSEPELAWRLNAGRTRLVAVTGTNGKTTTTELAAACLRAPAVGNIGPPLCGALAVADPPELAVAELSSFQLRFAAALRADVGVLLNVSPDHLDWHPDLADYEASKARVWANQRPDDTAVVFVDDDGAARVRRDHPPAGRVVEVSLDAPPPGGVGVRRGALHSRMDGARGDLVALDALATDHPAYLADAACAAACALAAGAPADAVGPRLAEARPGPHRIEACATLGGVTYVNDSKATNPHAAAAALSAHASVVWIAGGLNKGLDFSPLRALLPQRVRAVVTVGRAAEEIAALATGAGVPTVHAGTIEAAVPTAAGLARPGDVVLLSPACASMDQFTDYAARGDAFRRAVDALAAEASAPASEEATDGSS